MIENRQEAIIKLMENPMSADDAGPLFISDKILLSHEPVYTFV